MKIANLFILILALTCQIAYSQSFGNSYYRLTNKWLGDGKSLDVVNDNHRDKLNMADSDASSGQAWKLTAVGDGYYRLTNEWLGAEKSLNVINDDSDDKLNLATSNNVTGQFWKITPIGGGYYRLTTKWLGEERSLDVINDDVRNKVHLAETSEFSGQFWKVSPVSGDSTADDISCPIKTSIRPLSEFKKISFSGFTVNVHPELIGKAV